MKFATRFDSPACIDIFDKKLEIQNGTLKLEATCLNDQKRLLYKLELDLWDQVAEFNPSYNHTVEEYEKKLKEYN